MVTKSDSPAAMQPQDGPTREELLATIRDLLPLAEDAAKRAIFPSQAAAIREQIAAAKALCETPANA